MNSSISHEKEIELRWRIMYKYILKNNIKDEFLSIVYDTNNLLYHRKKCEQFINKKIGIIELLKTLSANFFNFHDWANSKKGFIFWSTHHNNLYLEYGKVREFQRIVNNLSIDKKTK